MQWTVNWTKATAFMLMVFHVSWPLLHISILWNCYTSIHDGLPDEYFFHIFSQLAFNFIVLASHVKCYYYLLFFFIFVIFHGCRTVMGLVMNLLLYDYFLHCSSFSVKAVHYFYNFVLSWQSLFVWCAACNSCFHPWAALWG